METNISETNLHIHRFIYASTDDKITLVPFIQDMRGEKTMLDCRLEITRYVKSYAETDIYQETPIYSGSCVIFLGNKSVQKAKNTKKTGAAEIHRLAGMMLQYARIAADDPYISETEIGVIS